MLPSYFSIRIPWVIVIFIERFFVRCQFSQVPDQTHLPPVATVLPSSASCAPFHSSYVPYTTHMHWGWCGRTRMRTESNQRQLHDPVCISNSNNSALRLHFINGQQRYWFICVYCRWWQWKWARRCGHSSGRWNHEYAMPAHLKLCDLYLFIFHPISSSSSECPSSAGTQYAFSVSTQYHNPNFQPSSGTC